ncbi:MAG: tripartite tricarboxylate transporter permease, partial [Rhizobiales bacterium]|nr:tripartite tricarboxylate transporter permease [Hyphomicrobiales bacterium]
ESANNAKEGGALVPTLAFGVPGSASMSLLLGAFLIHGISPGPAMLGPQLDITFTLIWTVAIANILGAGTCFLFAGQFAKIARIRAGILVPLVLAIMMIGAFQGGKDFGDLIVLLLAGVVGWVMKRLGWPRPPLILAFVLGALIENYLFVAHLRYGTGWMLKPVPFVLLCVMAVILFRPLLSRFFKKSSDKKSDETTELAAEKTISTPFYARGPELVADLGVWALFVGLFVFVIITSSGWGLPAKLMPQSLAIAGLIAVVGFGVFRYLGKVPRSIPDEVEPFPIVLRQLAWLTGLILSVWLIGMVPAIAVFASSYMVIEGKIRPLKTLTILVPFMIAIILLFHFLLHLPWPQSFLGDLVPALRLITGKLL